MSTRLHRLGGAIETFATGSSHPRELTDRREFQEAVNLLVQADVPQETVRQYALGANSALSCVALASLAGRADRDQLMASVLGEFSSLMPWPIYFGLEYLLAVDDRPPVGAPVLSARDWWVHNFVVAGLFRDYFDRRKKLGDPASFGAMLGAEMAAQVPQIENFLTKVDHPFAALLLAELRKWKAATVDRDFLRSMGRIWPTEEQGELLVEPAAWGELLRTAESALLQEAPRSLLVSGEPRVGKTSFLRLLGRLLQERGWMIFEASGVDLQADQMFIGQLEGRNPASRPGVVGQQACHVVHRGSRAPGDERQSCRAGGKHSGSDPSGREQRPADHTGRGDTERNQQAPAAPAGPAQRLRADPHAGAYRSGDRHAGSEVRRAPGNSDGPALRSRYRSSGALPGASVPGNERAPGKPHGSPQAVGQPRRGQLRKRANGGRTPDHPFPGNRPAEVHPR